MPPLDYRNKVVLAPMVRAGELPNRLLALQHGADLVWGPETVDRAILGTQRVVNDKTGCIEFVKPGKVIYRIHPLEQGRLVYQLGSADAALAVEAAKLVAKDVAGVDLNCGCPKHFSIHGGMGAALLKDIPRLEGILKALVEQVGKVFDIGVSCKIRLLATDEETYDMVRRLCRTGIIGLTVHCRTTPMRNTEKALLDRIRGIAEICREEGVACLANGDVESYEDGLRVMKEYQVDGAMIARSAEINPSCFRRGSPLPSMEIAKQFVEKAIEVDNHISNTKYCLTRILSNHGKHPIYQKVAMAKTIKDLCDVFEMQYAEKLSEAPSRGENSAAAKAAGGKMQRSEKEIGKIRGGLSKSSLGTSSVQTGHLEQGERQHLIA